MGLLQMMLWLVYPYAVIAVLGMGLIWQVHPRLEQEEVRSIQRFHKFLNRTTIALMLLSFLTGIGVVLFNRISDDPEKLYHWVKSLMHLEPDTALIEDISLLSRTHFILLLTFLFILPFSKYIRYLWIPGFFSKEKWSNDSTNMN